MQANLALDSAHAMVRGVLAEADSCSAHLASSRHSAAGDGAQGQRQATQLRARLKSLSRQLHQKHERALLARHTANVVNTQALDAFARRQLPLLRSLAAALLEHWRRSEAAEAGQLEVAQAAAARSCAYLGCANLGFEGGPAAGEGAGAECCRWARNECMPHAPKPCPGIKVLGGSSPRRIAPALCPTCLHAM